ncbi:MAG: DUF3617 domain-containing protein [Pseudomonadota bacterium]|nr:DUF3617 domain-containing protein [Pseudomonadota bacterium]
MKTSHGPAYVLSLALITLALPATAADRMRPGQWVGSTVVGAKTYPSSSCVSQADADAMNGDAKSVQVLLQKTIPPEICKLSDVKVSGGEVVYTATCRGQPGKVVTTTYHGDSSDGTDSAGGKTTGKLVGACK